MRPETLGNLRDDGTSFAAVATLSSGFRNTIAVGKLVPRREGGCQSNASLEIAERGFVSICQPVLPTGSK